MNDLDYPFRTKKEAVRYGKEVERKTGNKYTTEKVIFKTHVYKLFCVKKTKKSQSLKHQ